MAMKKEKKSGLSGQDFAELEALLSEGGESEDAMMIDEADGFLAGIALSPAQIPSRLWLSEIIRPCGFPAGSAKEMRLSELLVSRQAELAARLKEGLPFDPVILEDDEEQTSPEALAPFAFGFYKAAQMGPGLIDTDDEDIAGAVLAILRFMPEGAFADDDPMAPLCAAFAGEDPVCDLDEALLDMGEALSAIAEKTILKGRKASGTRLPGGQDKRYDREPDAGRRGKEKGVAHPKDRRA